MHTFLHSRQHRLHDLEANVLALFVTIQPEDQVVHVLGLAGQKRGHLEFGRRLLLLRGAGEQLGRIRAVPVVVLGREVERVDVTTDGGHLELGTLENR